MSREISQMNGKMWRLRQYIKLDQNTGWKIRGLFLTNNISKVYEKIVKNRNAENFKEEISEWQTGGVVNRATVDNVIIATAIIEQNVYLKNDTYLVLTDAEKCFDKLWLKDGVCELWRCGTDVRDCVMIKKLNEKANIVVKTPVGDTDPFTLFIKVAFMAHRYV